MSWRTAILTTCLGLAAFAVAACGGGGQDESAERADDTAPAAAADTAPPLDAPTDAGPRDDAASGPAEVRPAPAAAAEPEPAPAPTEATAPPDAEADDDTEPAAESEPPAAPADSSDSTSPQATEILTGPSVFAQPDPEATVEEIPDRPAAFADYGSVALPWLQGRMTVADIVPIFEAWGSPPVAGGSRLNLVDTNADALAPGDGRSALVIVWTDPATFGADLAGSNLVVYEPLLDTPGRFRIAYDHNALKAIAGEPATSVGIAVRLVEDVTGDLLRDISFEEVICDDGGCTTVSYVLSNEGDGYRRTVVAEPGGAS